MAERIQLKEPGSEFVMAVGSVHPRDIDNTEYFLFANGQKEILIPASSVERQLERLGVPAPEQLAGKTIKFSRSTKLNNFKKPYWNLDLASGAEQSAGGGGNAGTSASAPPVEPSEKPRLDRIYIRATKLILDEVVPLYTKAGIGCSDGAVAAMVATLFIAASKVEAQ